MIKLFIYRIIPLGIRPATIILEGMLANNQNILIQTLPISMMALMLSSIPVHLEYYKSKTVQPALKILETQYISGLTWLILIFTAALTVIISLPPLNFTSNLIIITCSMFLIEKLADESSRSLEFRKKFFGWFLVQFLRSAWLLIPLTAAFLGLNYAALYLVFCLLTALTSLFIFIHVTGLLPSLNLRGFTPIKNNIVFFFGSFLPASYRQLPRFIVAQVYPEQAHTFLAIAQIGQGINVMFNVRFQIPYRKLIARRPLKVQTILEPTMRCVLLLPILTSLLYVSGPIFIDLSQTTSFHQMIFFAPVVFAEALLFAIIAAHLGYIQWIGKRHAAMIYYLVCITLGLTIGVVLFNANYTDVTNLTGIPVITIIVGIIWLLIAKATFFQTQNTKAHE